MTDAILATMVILTIVIVLIMVIADFRYWWIFLIVSLIVLIVIKVVFMIDYCEKFIPVRHASQDTPTLNTSVMNNIPVLNASVMNNIPVLNTSALNTSVLNTPVIEKPIIASCHPQPIRQNEISIDYEIIDNNPSDYHPEYEFIKNEPVANDSTIAVSNIAVSDITCCGPSGDYLLPSSLAPADADMTFVRTLPDAKDYMNDQITRGALEFRSSIMNSYMSKGDRWARFGCNSSPYGDCKPVMIG